MIGEIAQLLGVLLAVPVSDKIGKKATFISVLLTITVLSVLIWFLPQNNFGFWMLIVLQVLICIAVGINSPMLWSMFADVADYSELKHGTASTGLIFSSSSMAQKFGGALGAFLLMQVLAWAGYDAALASQAGGTLTAIKALMSIVPAVGSLLGLVCLIFYPLSTARMKTIQCELETKRNK
jgi:GPH family glycoside/pentoside/hexuronide:cation symporter